MFYGTQILTEAGFGRQIAIIANVANDLTSVIATFFGIWLLGKIGRVTMFKAGILGTMGSLLIIALAAMNLEGSPSLPYIVLSMTIVFLWFMQSCIEPCLWLIIAEFFPLQLRGLGMGIAIFCLWIFDALVGSMFPVVLDQFGLGAAFFVFVFTLMIASRLLTSACPKLKENRLRRLNITSAVARKHFKEDFI